MTKLRTILTAILLISAAATGLFSAGCKGGLRAPNMMSKSQEIDLGRQAAQDVEQHNKVIASGPQYDQLQRIASRIFPEASADYDVPYTVKLIDSKEVNAFALPGGPIYFYKGLMDLTGSDDEVASVLGHESTHIVKRHAAKQISDAQTKGFLASIFLGRSSSLLQTLASIGLQIDQLKYSREDEAQADENGFRYLVNAGYDPDAMANMFRKLKSQEGKGGGGPEWLQNHPLTDKRVENAQKWADDYKREHVLP